ncbi:MAG: glycosyltransferase family 2 protein, partial [Acidobacteriaceae bacterium]
MTDLSIIIVNWNSTAWLLKCLESVYAQTHETTFEIIVVDNASPDGDVGIVKERYPDVVLIESSENLGFAGANNLGSRSASGEYVVFLNPDTVLLNPAFDLMLRQAHSLPSLGAAGCTLLNEDESIQVSCIQTFPTILNQLLDMEVLLHRFPACPLWNIAPLFAGGTEPSRVEVISGACVLFRR